LIGGDERLGKQLRFIDLFAGLGGFHQALQALGHRCVFACEVDDSLAALYEKNFANHFGVSMDLLRMRKNITGVTRQLRRSYTGAPRRC
jgi:site-specific DNA-cytosine methylase